MNKKLKRSLKDINFLCDLHGHRRNLLMEFESYFKEQRKAGYKMDSTVIDNLRKEVDGIRDEINNKIKELKTL